MCPYRGLGYFSFTDWVCVRVLLCTAECTLTCGEGEELSPHSQNGTQQTFVRGKPENFSVYDLPAVVSVVQIIAATFLIYIVPVGEVRMDVTLCFTFSTHWSPPPVQSNIYIRVCIHIKPLEPMC